MSKFTPLPRIDRDYQKDLKFPDINDFLKDTSYAENSTSFNDNQTYALLDCKASINVTPKLLSNFIVEGVVQKFYMIPIELLGYNSDLESVEKMTLTVDFLNADAPKILEFTRGKSYDSIVTLPGQTIVSGGGTLYNYKIQLSVATVESILTWVFNTNQVLARFYYTSNADTLINYLRTQFYSMHIPLKLSVYYFNAKNPANVYSTSLSFSTLAQILTASLAVKSATVYPYVYTANDAGVFSKYLTLKATFSTPVTSNAIWIGATISGTLFKAIEQVAVTEGVLQTDSAILRNAVAAYGHSNYSVTYPTINFDYSANSEAFTGAASISGVPLTNFTPKNFAPIVQSLKLLDYFIGHTFDSTSFQIKVKFSAKKNALTLSQPNTFLLEFMQPDNPRTEKYDPTGQVSLTVPKSKLVIRSSFPSIPNVTSTSAVSANAYVLLSGLGHIYRSAYFDNSTKVYNSVVQKVLGESFTQVNYASKLSKFSVSLESVPSTVTTEETYVLSIKWNDPSVATGLFLTAELPIIRLSIGDFMYQLYAQGTLTKSLADNYTRTDNPFYNELVTPRVLRWSPRMSAILVNNNPLSTSVQGGVSALDATTVIVPPTAIFYKLPLINNVTQVTYALRLYCRGYTTHPRLLIANAPVLNRDALGFKRPYATGPRETIVTEGDAVGSSFTLSFTKEVLNNLNVTINKSPRSYLLTNLKIVTLSDKSVYYTYADTGAATYTPRCEIGFYYEKS